MSVVSEAKERVAALTTQLQTLEQEVAILKARAASRKEAVAHALRSENAAAKKDLALLVEAEHSLAMDALHPTDEGAAKLQLESLRQSVVTYCTNAKVDQELWKKLES